MALVRDVATYILAKQGPMSAMKLQKLVYYSQAWHLVWEERSLFSSRIEAWANGPVIPDLYQFHRRQFTVGAADIGGEAAALDEGEASSVDEVLRFYGRMTAHELSDLTHREDPWVNARNAAGLAPMQRGNAEITTGEMHDFYLAVATAGADQ